MITIDEMEVLLDEAAASLPAQIFDGLNGGIVLLPEAKLNPKGVDGELYIMGEYHGGGNLGRYISIYYGSFIAVYGHLEKQQMKKRLAHTLKHEFVHHLESMAGVRDLEQKDAEWMEKYLRSKEL